MTEMMNIRIMLLVGSNGKTSACVDGVLDWEDLVDGIVDWTPDDPVYPAATSRHIVTVSVPKPEVSEIAGTVEDQS